MGCDESVEQADCYESFGKGFVLERHLDVNNDARPIDDWLNPIAVTPCRMERSTVNRSLNRAGSARTVLLKFTSPIDHGDKLADFRD